VVAALCHSSVPYRLAATSADVVFVCPDSPVQAAGMVEEIRALEARERRSGPPLVIMVDLVVFADDAPGVAVSRKASLDELLGHPYRSDAAVFAGTPGELADLLQEWQVPGVHGFRLRPGALPHDLRSISRSLVPLLQQQGRYHRSYPTGTLRGRLGLDRPANRYAHAGGERR